MSLKRRDFIRNLLIGGASVPVLSACGGGGGGGDNGGDPNNAPGGGNQETGNTHQPKQHQFPDDFHFSLCWIPRESKGMKTF